MSEMEPPKRGRKDVPVGYIMKPPYSLIHRPNLEGTQEAPEPPTYPGVALIHGVRNSLRRLNSQPPQAEPPAQKKT